MHFLKRSLVLLAVVAACIAASPAAPGAAVGTVSVRTKHQGTFVGHSSSVGDQFYGIPFAEAPVGKLRLANPVPRKRVSSKHVTKALEPGKGCMQSLAVTYPESYSEDCLFLNIYRPSSAHRRKPLPVLVWIYGGGWSDSNATESKYNATNFIQRSVQLDEPLIYLSFNYRLGSFGFLGGEEVEKADATNLGYKDQRLALKWVQQNIAAFGGDPTKVTIFGESAGANCVGAQMMANKGNVEGLFRAAILESGSQALRPRYAATAPRIQGYYAALLNATSCDKLPCLRALSAEEMLVGQLAITAESNALSVWQPVLDDFFVAELPSAQYKANRFPDMPFISGSDSDEGTLFASKLTLNDTAWFQSFVEKIGADQSMYDLKHDLLRLYPDDPSLGSPFRPEMFGLNATDRIYGAKNQFKRQAALLNDAMYQAGRRQQLMAAKRRNKSKAWTYLFSQPDPKGPPANGIYHSSEMQFVYNLTMQGYEGETQSATGKALARYASKEAIRETAAVMSAAWIHFATNLSPAGPDVPHWPSYDSEGDNMLYIQGGNMSTIRDDYRQEQMQFILDQHDVFRI